MAGGDVGASASGRADAAASDRADGCADTGASGCAVAGGFKKEAKAVSKRGLLDGCYIADSRRLGASKRKSAAVLVL